MRPKYAINIELSGKAGGLSFDTPNDRIDLDFSGVIVQGSGSSSTQQYNFLSPLSVWLINHNSGRNVNAEAFTLGGSKVYADVVNLNPNQVQITFDLPQSGYALVT